MKDDKKTKDQLIREVARLRQRVEELEAMEEDILRAEERTKTTLMKKDMLVREIHHRVKNNMQVIMSLLTLQSTYINSKKMNEILRECQNRIKSMCLIHEKLYLARDLSDVSSQDYISKLVKSIFISYGAHGNGIKCLTNVGNVRLDIETAVPCGLIITELVSNSLKHAFNAEKKGLITVGLQKLKTGQYELSVQDSGSGFPKGMDYKNSPTLGLQLVSTLAEEQLRGNLSIRATTKGTEFKVTFKPSRH